MSKVFDQPFEEVVKARYSVRTYSSKPLSGETIGQIEAYIKTLFNPFGQSVAFRLIESAQAVNAKQLGTYGMIKGASHYIGVTVKNTEGALEAVGYEFEKLILFAASLGLGTCWLGGTFNKSEFSKAMGVQPDTLFPAISPIGWPEGKRLQERVVRRSIQADRRKPWKDLFFNNGFSEPLAEADAGAYAFPLEMARLAPSASNKQPWRIVRTQNAFHFYEAKAEGYSDRAGFDIQRIDMGIAACHFHLAAMEKELNGEFQRMEPQLAGVTENTHYVFSWICA
ncbi:MAG TPA: nitroreductase family protein [Feifaniaceae bacterium]|nr:nitroreductase family protein [Feifaniaceae bacterium]